MRVLDYISFFANSLAGRNTLPELRRIKSIKNLNLFCSKITRKIYEVARMKALFWFTLPPPCHINHVEGTPSYKYILEEKG